MIKFLNTSFTTTQHNFRWAEDFFQFAKRFFRNNFFPQNNSGMLMTPRLGFQRKTLLFPPRIMVGIWLVSRPCRESMKFWRETWPHWKRRYMVTSSSPLALTFIMDIPAKILCRMEYKF